MRPVDKGVAPRPYSKYQDARDDLVAVLGPYCSYCERFIENLAVEHVIPKSRRVALMKSWSNFLLACVNCNSCKGKKRVALAKYFWPDSDNTFRAIDYSFGGLVKPAYGLNAANKVIANATIELTGLDRFPGHPEKKKQPTIADDRWLRRYEAWSKAEKDKLRLNGDKKSVPLREHIAEKAAERGMFSIWLTVFSSDTDMKCRLLDAFLGTCKNSFDANGEAKKRSGGKL